MFTDSLCGFGRVKVFLLSLEEQLRPTITEHPACLVVDLDYFSGFNVSDDDAVDNAVVDGAKLLRGLAVRLLGPLPGQGQLRFCRHLARDVVDDRQKVLPPFKQIRHGVHFNVPLFS